GTATGNIHLAPGFASAGVYNATVRASNGLLVSDRTLTITVCNGCARAPLLNPIANMTVTQTSTANQTITASDPDGNALTFTATDPDGSAITFTSSGPTFMTRTDNPQSGATRTGNIHLAPSPTTTSGTFAASVTATVGGACPGSDSKSFTITVCPSGPPPLLA